MNETRKIFKYVIDVADESELMLPAGSKVQSVIAQGKTIVLYAVVTPEFFAKEKVLQKISIRVVETGHEIKFDLQEFQFLGTVSLLYGGCMFHVFYHDHGYLG